MLEQENIGEERRKALSEHDAKLLCGKLMGVCEENGKVLICLPICQTIGSEQGKLLGDISFFVVPVNTFGENHIPTKDELIYRANVLSEIKSPSNVYIPIDNLNLKRQKYVYEPFNLKGGFLHTNAELKECYPDRDKVVYKICSNDYVVNDFKRNKDSKWRILIGISKMNITVVNCTDEVFTFFCDVYDTSSKYPVFVDIYKDSLSVKNRKSLGMNNTVFVDNYTYYTNTNYPQDINAVIDLYKDTATIVAMRRYIIDIIESYGSVMQEGYHLLNYSDFLIKL